MSLESLSQNRIVAGILTFLLSCATWYHRASHKRMRDAEAKALEAHHTAVEAQQKLDHVDKKADEIHEDVREIRKVITQRQQ